MDNQYNEWVKLYGVEIANQLKDKYANQQVKKDFKARNPSDYKIKKIKALQREKLKSRFSYIRNKLIKALLDKQIVPIKIIKKAPIRKLIKSLVVSISNAKDEICFSDSELYEYAALIQKEFENNAKVLK